MIVDDRSEDVCPFRSGSCFHCGEPGHYFYECPDNEDAKEVAAPLPERLVYRALRYEEDPIVGLRASRDAPFRSVAEAIYDGSKKASPYIHSTQDEDIAVIKYCKWTDFRRDVVLGEACKVERVGLSSRLRLLGGNQKGRLILRVHDRAQTRDLSSDELKALTYVERGTMITLEGARVAVIDLDRLPRSVRVYSGAYETEYGTVEGNYARKDKEIVIDGVVPPHAIIAVWCKECFDCGKASLSADEYWHTKRDDLRTVLRSCAVDGDVIKFRVVGVTHYQDVVEGLKMDQVLTVEADNNNLFDPGAVKVLTSKQGVVGYVPKEMTSIVRSALIDGVAKAIVIDLKLWRQGETGVSVKLKAWIPKKGDWVRVRSGSMKKWCHDGFVKEVAGEMVKVAYNFTLDGIGYLRKWLPRWSDELEFVQEAPACTLALVSADRDTINHAVHDELADSDTEVA